MTTPTMEKIKVMLAFDEGKKIEYKHNGSCLWLPTQNPHWNWVDVDYRIAPPPPRRFTRWFIELSDSKFIGPYHDKDTAKNSQYLYGSSTITAFEMTEILDNAEC